MIYLIVEQCEDLSSSYYIFRGFFYSMSGVAKYLQSCDDDLSNLLLFTINENSSYNIEMLDGYPTLFKRI